MAKKPGFDLDADVFWSEIHKFIDHKKIEIEDKRQSKRDHDKVRRCPDCAKTMEVLTLHKVLIDRCPECFGIFLDQGELELLFKTQSESGFIPSLKKFLKINS